MLSRVVFLARSLIRVFSSSVYGWLFEEHCVSLLREKHLKYTEGGTGAGLARKTLILDLDETLVHSTVRLAPHLNGAADLRFEARVGGELMVFHVFRRPHLESFLRAVARCYHVVIWTASVRAYADPLIDLVDPERLVCRRLYREDCESSEAGYVKDLAARGFDLSSTLILDNSPVSYSRSPDNALPVSTFFDNPEDTELLNLMSFLDALRWVTDVRSILSMRA